MPFRNPPPSVPVRTYPSPKLTDQVLVEWVNNEVGDYTPIEPGAAHPNQREFAGFFLGIQRQNPGDHNFIQRVWVTPETSSDAFNYALKFSAEDNSFPAFIRTYRELKSTYTPRAKQSALGTLYKLVLDNVGTGYAVGSLPAVTFDNNLDPAPDSVAIAHGIVSPDGSLSECVLDFGGEGYVGNVAFTVEDPIDGSPASGTAYIQPTAAILVKEEANLFPPDSEFYAQYLQVTRVYETLPGPTLYSTKLDVDGKILTVGTTRKLCADITTGEGISAGIWTKTTKKQTDIDFVCEEVVETRAIPGFTMESTKIDEDGVTIFRTQTYVDSTTIVSSETIVAGNWIRKFEEDVDGTSKVSWQIVETRAVPGNPIPENTIDEDGKTISSVRTLKDKTTITPSEVISAGVWIKTESKSVGDKVSWEVVTARPVPGNAVPSSAIDQDHEIVSVAETMVDTSTITTGASESGGIITTTEKIKVSDLVSKKRVTTKVWLDAASYSVSIPESIIPIEFRASITTTVESHIVAGIASMPTLAAGEFEHSKKQLTKLLYEERITRLSDLEFPINQIGHETSSEYGGAVLDVNRTLDDSSLNAEEGEDIVSSFVNPIGDSLMWFRETKKRPSTDAEWPTIPSDKFDKEMQVKALVEEQVVDPGYTEATGTYFIENLKGLDKWRSRRTKLTREPTAVSLATALVEEIDGPYQFPGLIYLAPGGGGYFRKQASAQLCQQIIRTWWLSSATKPTRGLPGSGDDVEVQDIIMDDIVISTLNNVTTLAYSGMALHDAITTFGVFIYAATVPSATDYIAMIGTEIVVGASIESTDIPQLWKIQTKSLVAR